MALDKETWVKAQLVRIHHSGSGGGADIHGQSNSAHRRFISTWPATCSQTCGGIDDGGETQTLIYAQNVDISRCGWLGMHQNTAWNGDGVNRVSLLIFFTECNLFPLSAWQMDFFFAPLSQATWSEGYHVHMYMHACTPWLIQWFCYGEIHVG